MSSLIDDDPTPPGAPSFEATTLLPAGVASPPAAVPSLGRRYELDALLGKGGQGVVWRARDRVLRRDVALKMLRLDARSDPAQVSAFFREAQLTALLEHPGIVPLHDLGLTDDGAPCIVLRRIEGKSLAETLAETRSLDERLRLVPALLRACHAVAYAHQHQVVHRDLKPQNIMLGAFGETYVLDWGLAVAGPEAEAQVVGTPAYMCPEQASGLPADPRSDVWGLGACLYEVLTGEAPISGRSLGSAMGHAAKGEFSPVAVLEPAAPPELAAICEQALAPLPSARYPSAVALAQDLDAWLAGRTVSAHDYSGWELLRRAWAANRRAITVALLALASLGVAVGVAEARVRRERNEARRFARDLLRDLPEEIDLQKSDLELVHLLVERTERWLARVDLTPDEQVDACEVLMQLANAYADTAQVTESRRLNEQALALARRGRAEFPEHPGFFACEAHALTTLGFAAHGRGDAASGEYLLGLAAGALDAWRGAPDPNLTLARARLLSNRGDLLWAASPEDAVGVFTEAAALGESLLDDPRPRVRKKALLLGYNGVAGLWSSGRRADALQVARRFYERGSAVCEDTDVRSLRACLSVTAPYATLLEWERSPESQRLRERAGQLVDELARRDSDSTTALSDAANLSLERGDFAAASRYAATVRGRGAGDWVLAVGALAAALAGDLEEVDRWEPLARESSGGARLARGLREAARGRYAAAAAELRAVRGHVWYELSWSPHPRPALVLPPAAQPAFERFLGDFTRAFGDADHAALAEAIEALATSLEALSGEHVPQHGPGAGSDQTG